MHRTLLLLGWLVMVCTNHALADVSTALGQQDKNQVMKNDNVTIVATTGQAGIKLEALREEPELKGAVNKDLLDVSTSSIAPTTTTTTEAPQLTLHIGNNTISNVCNISSDDYTKLTSFYPQHCIKDEGESEGQDAGGAVVDIESGNETQSCHTSVDLPEMGAAEQEHLSSLSIFLILCVLAVCVILIFFLLKTKLNYLPESVACVIVGGVIGLVLKILYSQHIANWQKEETFSPTVFFLVILPPIIFESGYNLHKGNFFQNIGSIVVFAVMGTLISALIVGGGVYLLGQLGD